MERARAKKAGRAVAREKAQRRKLPKASSAKALRARTVIGGLARAAESVPSTVCPEDRAVSAALRAECRRRSLSLPSRFAREDADTHPWLTRIAHAFRIVVEVVAYLLGFPSPVRRLGPFTRAHVLAQCSGA